MEHIRQALDRAKQVGATVPDPTVALAQPQFQHVPGVPMATRLWGREVALDPVHLESKRIISYNVSDPRSKSFDMLRTQVLQSMAMNSWQIVGTTSPSAACGKSVVSANLALSIARQQERPVLLVDLDLQKPQVARYLGIPCDSGIISLLEGRTTLADSLVRATVKSETISVLPCEASTLSSSEWMASKRMASIIQTIKRDFKDWTVIVDLPPLLTGDDVITFLPSIDCVLFLAAVGTTTVSEIKECYKHLAATSVVRVVLNKSTEMPATYYSRYAES